MYSRSSISESSQIISSNPSTSHNIFPATLNGFLERYGNSIYSTFIERVDKRKTSELSRMAEVLFDALMKTCSSNDKFEVFVMNWIPDCGATKEPLTQTCSKAYQGVERDVKGSFTKTDKIQGEENIYRIFQLVTINCVLRHRNDDL